MKLYDVTLTASAKRKVSLLANSVAEAEMKALNIYLGTDLLDIDPHSLIISHVQADEVTTLDREDVCDKDCNACPYELSAACAFSETAKSTPGKR